MNQVPNLQLLAVFVTVIEQGSISKAALYYNTNQSTISSMMSRLKVELGHELFIRKGRNLAPTSFAKGFYQEIKSTVHKLSYTMSDAKSFEPKTSNRKFNITTPENLQWFLNNQFNESSLSNVHLDIYDHEYNDKILYEALVNKQYDIAIDFLEMSESDIKSEFLYESDFVVICNRDHPRVKLNLTFDDYFREEHAVLKRVRNNKYSLDFYTSVDLSNRNIAFYGSSMINNMIIVSRTNLIAIIPLTLALEFKEVLGLNLFRVPFHCDKGKLYMLWHKRNIKDRAHSWLRGKITQLIINTWN
ncbi:LysR family transcriptional regulator [Vibrio makurazakiensis]|uniref:LysR family transcriptional regulator n=1 Tax=Vibrio makurazakiensis TaxID=2910250 RepID=UPI003D0CE56D